MEMQDLDILLVEPSQTQRHLISDYLGDLGIEQVTSCSEGKEAINELRKHPHDLVISTLYLPDSTGTDLIQMMRKMDALSGIPFILISSETDFRVLDPIRQSGSIAILPKPFELEQLKQAMHATLELLDPESLHLEELHADELQILIVDDSSFSRNHIRRILSGMGIENIDEASNGEEAVRKINEQFFDLIVTDYNMPQMDGQELVEYIRGKSSQSSLPIIMVTSEENDSRLAAVQQSGVSAICDKPFEPSTVKGMIENLINQA